MTKINILILSFLTIAYSQAHAMSKHKQGELDRAREEARQAVLLTQVMGSFKLTSNIKTSFLKLKDFDEEMDEDVKISKITTLLQTYQDAHKRFIHSRLSCNPENLLPKYLQGYCFCNSSIQDRFQAKANSLLGGYVLDLHQWFEEMRSTEYEALSIPYRLING